MNNQLWLPAQSFCIACFINGFSSLLLVRMDLPLKSQGGTVMLLFTPDEMWHKLRKIGISLCLVHSVQIV